ncbi:MAG: hypothetical protein QNJ09_13090 [Paracoccaceae bacterium]|nr:hypothetical protein [Paracoccaceae bacterium]
MSYSYLITGLILAVAGLVASRLSPSLQWFVLAAGVLAAPAGLADVLFVPEYWQPQHIIGAWFSIEGVLFSFGNGCLIAAMIALWFPEIAPEKPQVIWQPVYRCASLMLPGFLAFLAAWQGGFGSLMIMHAAYLGFAVMFVLMALQRRLSLKVVIFSGVGFAALYSVQTLLWYWLDPGFPRFWSAAPYVYVLEIPPFLPVEEYLWAFLYGGLWSSLMLFAFEARLPRSVR